MFNFFKKKTPLEKLHEEYETLQNEAFQLSKTNRTESDRKQAEAQEILQQIEAIEKAS